MILLLAHAMAQPVQITACFDTQAVVEDCLEAVEGLGQVSSGPATPEEWMRTGAGRAPETWAERPVAHVPVVQVLSGAWDSVSGWMMVDAGGEVVLPSVQVASGPQWVEVVSGENGAWLGFAPTTDGLVVVLMADGEVRSQVLTVEDTVAVR